jgi:hypothetical protein
VVEFFPWQNVAVQSLNAGKELAETHDANPACTAVGIVLLFSCTQNPKFNPTRR